MSCSKSEPSAYEGSCTTRGVRGVLGACTCTCEAVGVSVCLCFSACNVCMWAWALARSLARLLAGLPVWPLLLCLFACFFVSLHLDFISVLRSSFGSFGFPRSFLWGVVLGGWSFPSLPSFLPSSLLALLSSLLPLFFPFLSPPFFLSFVLSFFCAFVLWFSRSFFLSFLPLSLLSSPLLFCSLPFYFLWFYVILFDSVTIYLSVYSLFLC